MQGLTIAGSGNIYPISPSPVVNLSGYVNLFSPHLKRAGDATLSDASTSKRLRMDRPHYPPSSPSTSAVPTSRSNLVPSSSSSGPPSTPPRVGDTAPKSHPAIPNLSRSPAPPRITSSIPSPSHQDPYKYVIDDALTRYPLPSQSRPTVGPSRVPHSESTGETLPVENNAMRVRDRTAQFEPMKPLSPLQKLPPLKGPPRNPSSTSVEASAMAGSSRGDRVESSPSKELAQHLDGPFDREFDGDYHPLDSRHPLSPPVATLRMNRGRGPSSRNRKLRSVRTRSSNSTAKPRSLRTSKSMGRLYNTSTPELILVDYTSTAPVNISHPHFLDSPLSHHLSRPYNLKLRSIPCPKLKRNRNVAFCSTVRWRGCHR